MTVHKQIRHNALEPLTQVLSHVSREPWELETLIFGTAILVGVVYLHTYQNGSHAVGGRGVTCDRTRSGKIGPILANFEAL